MKYTGFLLAALILMILALPAGVMAQEDCHEGDGIHDGMEMCGECPYMVDGECTYEGECPHECDMEMMHPGMMGMMPFEKPWQQELPGYFWNQMGNRSRNGAAMRYMGEVRTVMILPFDDYTQPTMEGDPILNEVGGAMRLVDNLAAVLMEQGYLVVPPRDVQAAVNGYTPGNETEEVAAEPVPTPELENNYFYFDQMPSRAMDYYTTVVPGFERQVLSSGTQSTSFLMAEDIVRLAELFRADAVIRGFVNEYAIADDIEADWRTFIPPFLGLLNPDRRVTIEIVYYLYDGHTGELIWNETVSMQKNTDWPLFNSDEELIRDIERNVVLGATESMVPNWQGMMMDHPEWMPFEMWENGGWPMGDMDVFRPDWLNPHRTGWHDEYLQPDWMLDLGEGNLIPDSVGDRDFTHSYNAYRAYLENLD